MEHKSSRKNRRLIILTLSIAVLFGLLFILYKHFHKTSTLELYSEALLHGKSGRKTLVLNITKDGLITDTITLHYTTVDSLEIFQGDIILGQTSGINKTKNYIDSTKKRGLERFNVLRPNQLFTSTTVWENKVVPYQYNRTVYSGDTVAIFAAMIEWQNKTNIHFIHRSNQTSYINFVSSNGYASQIGRIPGGQIIYVPSNPRKGSVMHEIGHSLGLWHEHCRDDRFKYITIHEENIDPKFLCQFIQQISDVSTLNTKYDLNSVMHYPKDAFTNNGSNTIDVLPPYDNNNYNVGNRDSLSQGDIDGIKRLYDLPIDSLKSRKPGQAKITCNNDPPSK